MPILPVVVDGARMPGADELSDSIRQLTTLNAAPLDNGRGFHQQTSEIISTIGRIVSAGNAARESGSENEGTPIVVPNAVAAQGFDVSHWSKDIEYKCREGGYTGWIDKLECFRDNERPPSQCQNAEARATVIDYEKHESTDAPPCSPLIRRPTWIFASV